MKFAAISGSIDKGSYNTKLLMFMANRFRNMADIDILDISQVPMFNESDDQTDSEIIQYLAAKISNSDGVIIATPEHDHTTTAALKSIIEWMSYKIHPFEGKPVLLVGASWTDQGSSRAQLDVRQILESPGVNAVVMPSDEFLLGNALTAFNENGNLKDDGTVAFLTSVMQKFVTWVKVMRAMSGDARSEADGEDLTASSVIDTTVEDVDMIADDWVEQAAEKTGAARGSDYVVLDRGILTVDQLNWFLNTMPMELTYADDNNQFIYYNHNLPSDKMLAPREPEQTGDPMSVVHPERAIPGVKRVIHALRTGKTDLVSMPVPGNKVNSKYIMHYYKAMRDADGRYRGVNEWVLDVWPVVEAYIKRTGQKLVPDGNAGKADAASSASVSGPGTQDDGAEAISSASVSDASSAAGSETGSGVIGGAGGSADAGSSASVS